MRHSWLQWFLWLLAVSGVRAHDPGLSTARVALTASSLTTTLTFAPADIAAFLSNNGTAAAVIDPSGFAKMEPQLRSLAPGLWEARSQSAPLSLLDFSVTLLPENNVEFRLSYGKPLPGPLVLRALLLDDFPLGHREYVSIVSESGALLGEKLISLKEPSVEFTVPTATEGASLTPEPLPSFWGFLKLGIRHILTGYDHLLFLFGLLVICRRWKSIFAIISCFTLAHSLTLALATLNLVQIPSRIIEPCIAASIVFVGVENLWRRGAEPKGRWALTFFFGLIHGFGFATVLRELGVGEGNRGLLMPLFTFNLGVEIGQISVAALFLPMLWQLRKNRIFLTYWVPALSCVVVLAGLYWLIERTLFT